MARAPTPYGDDEPWLAEGVREARSTVIPRARLFGGGVVALALAVLVALGVYLAAGRKSDGSTGYANPADAPVIAADAGPYKVAPTDPGGAKITGIDDTVAGVASGVDQASAIAPDEPEEPLARPVAGDPAAPPPTDLLPAAPPALPTRPVAAAPVVAPPVAKSTTPPARVARADADPLAPPTRPAPKAIRSEADPLAAPSAKPTRQNADPLAPPAKPDAARAARFDPTATAADGATAKANPTANGSVALQLGAFSTRDKADAAWTKAGGGGALAGLTKRIEPVERDGATLYRLRAAGVASKAAATALCGRIAAAGGACIVAD